MNTNGRRTEPSSAEPTGATGAPAKRRGIATIASGLWRQKLGPRPERPERPGSLSSVLSEKEIVDGLDVREFRLAIAATVIEAALTPILYFYWRTHGDATVRSAATDFLITGVISVALLLLGALLKRRALVGFAAFMTGFAWFTYGNIMLAVVFLFFGGWLIMRVMRKQKQDRAAGRPVEGFGPRSRSRAEAEKAKSRRAAPASKRYTPPRRATTGRKAGARKASQGPRR